MLLLVVTDGQLGGVSVDVVQLSMVSERHSLLHNPTIGERAALGGIMKRAGQNNNEPGDVWACTT